MRRASDTPFSSSLTSLRTGIISTALLLLLQILWHALLAPPPREYLPATLELAVLPLLPGLWAATQSLRRGVLISGIVCLFYFCHGIAEVFNSAAPRWLAVIEIVLTLTVIGALGLDVISSRRAKRAQDK